MKIKALALTVVLNMLMAGSAFAACTAPEDPAIPEGNTATGADMFKAKKDIESYMESAEAFLNCGGVPTMQYNRMVDKMEQVAKQFNSSLRAYKAKA